MKEHVSIFREAHDIAMTCTDTVRRDILRERTSQCRVAYDLICVRPTREAMQDLVGTWTRMLQAIDAVSPMGDDNPNGGRMTAPEPFDEVKANVA